MGSGQSVESTVSARRGKQKQKRVTNRLSKPRTDSSSNLLDVLPAAHPAAYHDIPDPRSQLTRGLSPGTTTEISVQDNTPETPVADDKIPVNRRRSSLTRSLFRSKSSQSTVRKSLPDSELRLYVDCEADRQFLQDYARRSLPLPIGAIPSVSPSTDLHFESGDLPYNGASVVSTAPQSEVTSTVGSGLSSASSAVGTSTPKEIQQQSRCSTVIDDVEGQFTRPGLLIRRSSLLTPGIATRQIEQPPAGSKWDFGFPIEALPPSSSLRARSGRQYHDGVVASSLLQPFELPAYADAPRARTPSELDYRPIGFAIGSLRCTNGAASPSHSMLDPLDSDSADVMVLSCDPVFEKKPQEEQRLVRLDIAVDQLLSNHGSNSSAQLSNDYIQHIDRSDLDHQVPSTGTSHVTSAAELDIQEAQSLVFSPAVPTKVEWPTYPIPSVEFIPAGIDTTSPTRSLEIAESYMRDLNLSPFSFDGTVPDYLDVTKSIFVPVVSKHIAEEDQLLDDNASSDSIGREKVVKSPVQNGSPTEIMLAGSLEIAHESPASRTASDSQMTTSKHNSVTDSGYGSKLSLTLESCENERTANTNGIYGSVAPFQPVRAALAASELLAEEQPATKDISMDAMGAEVRSLTSTRQTKASMSIPVISRRSFLSRRRTPQPFDILLPSFDNLSAIADDIPKIPASTTARLSRRFIPLGRTFKTVHKTSSKETLSTIMSSTIDNVILQTAETTPVHVLQPAPENRFPSPERNATRLMRQDPLHSHRKTMSSASLTSRNMPSRPKNTRHNSTSSRKSLPSFVEEKNQEAFELHITSYSAISESLGRSPYQIAVAAMQPSPAHQVVGVPRTEETVEGAAKPANRASRLGGPDASIHNAGESRSQQQDCNDGVPVNAQQVVPRMVAMIEDLSQTRRSPMPATRMQLASQVSTQSKKRCPPPVSMATRNSIRARSSPAPLVRHVIPETIAPCTPSTSQNSTSAEVVSNAIETRPRRKPVAIKQSSLQCPPQNPRAPAWAELPSQQQRRTPEPWRPPFKNTANQAAIQAAIPQELPPGATAIDSTRTAINSTPERQPSTHHTTSDYLPSWQQPYNSCHSTSQERRQVPRSWSLIENSQESSGEVGICRNTSFTPDERGLIRKQSLMSREAGTNFAYNSSTHHLEQEGVLNTVTERTYDEREHMSRGSVPEMAYNRFSLDRYGDTYGGETVWPGTHDYGIPSKPEGTQGQRRHVSYDQRLVGPWQYDGGRMNEVAV